MQLPALRFKRHGKVFRAYLFGHEFVIIGDKALLKGALSSEEDVGFTLPVATANEVINPYNMSDFHRHKSFVSFVPPWPGSCWAPWEFTHEVEGLAQLLPPLPARFQGCISFPQHIFFVLSSEEAHGAVSQPCARQGAAAPGPGDPPTAHELVDAAGLGAGGTAGALPPWFANI